MAPFIRQSPFSLGFYLGHTFRLIYDLFPDSPIIEKDALSKLMAQKEDEIWRIALFGDDGEIAKFFEALTGGPGASRDNDPSDKAEAGAAPALVRSHFMKTVEADVRRHVTFSANENMEEVIESRSQSLKNKLANTSRKLTLTEAATSQYHSLSTASILWIAIKREHKADIEYLLENCSLCLDTRCGNSMETVLHEAVSKRDLTLISTILKLSSSTSPSTYINLGDSSSRTPLHILFAITPGINLDSRQTEHILMIFDLLFEYGANVDALNFEGRTPLHEMIAKTHSIRKSHSHQQEISLPLLDCLLTVGAEVNSKDILGSSPLHTACELQDCQVIERLARNGADLETLNSDWKTPKQVFLSTPNRDEAFDITILTPSPTGVVRRKRQTTSIPTSERLMAKRKAISQKFPVYCRFQQNSLIPDDNGNTFAYWVATDKDVSDVLYPNQQRMRRTFLEECQKDSEHIWEAVQQRRRHTIMPSQDLASQDLQSSQSTGPRDEAIGTKNHPQAVTHDPGQNLAANLKRDIWRWVSFPANNMTWVTDFVHDTLKTTDDHEMKSLILNFFHDNVRAREAKQNISRIRIPHARIMPNPREDPSQQPDSDVVDFARLGPVLSLVIPFLDIEVDQDDRTPTRHNRNVTTEMEEAYFPFTGFDGVQVSQTLDQTANSIDSLLELRSKENQVIYRWSEKQIRMAYENKSNGPKSDYVPFLNRLTEVAESGQSGVAAKIQGIRQEYRRKWLMVRQLWLWKLDDGTILTAIPTRKNTSMADDLLETIRQSDLHEIASTGDLITHIVCQAVTFLDKFKWAGLGEHVLDIFQNEIAFEADKEASFFNKFSQKDWSSSFANKAIHEAAECTWRVKDIRDELRLIQKVFKQQLEVIGEFADIKYGPSTQTTGNMSGRGYERETFIEDTGLKRMIQRVDDMDKDAAATLEGLSNITQAMLAQASLKEAESSRLMNFILLPFTVVTVIFTPLSFMTSLFAVNSDGFPHNSNGELQIPSAWLAIRLCAGEFGTLIPLLVLVMFIYWLRTR